MSSNITISLVINYLALITSVWLGWYVLTRNPRTLISWLTSLTLWSLGGLFLNMILVLNPPPTPVSSAGWIRLLFPFWPKEAFENGWVGWLQGWQVTPAVVLWHHATTLMRPGGMNWWRWTRVVLGYISAIAAIWVQIFLPAEFADVSGDPYYLNTIRPGNLYFPFMLLLTVFTVFSLINLYRSTRSAPSSMHRRQLTTLGIATVTAGFTAPTAFLAAAFDIPIPRTVLTVLLAIAIVLIGYGVAFYSALIEGRTIRRDFFYNALAMGIVAMVYSFFTWLSVKIFNVPAAAFVFMIILSIVTHNLVDATRRHLDAFFYRRENRQMRANLRKLGNLVGDEYDLSKNLTQTFESICQSVRATFGLVLTFEGNQVKESAAYRFKGKSIDLPPGSYYADDVVQLEQNHFPEPLSEAALLIPLYSDIGQIGAAILGRPVNSTSYSNADIEIILYPSDLLSEVINNARRESDYIQQLSKLTMMNTQPEEISIKVVDHALKHLYDYALLSDSSLANLGIVNSVLSPNENTHLDLGKAINKVLVEAIEKLRPNKEKPRDPPSREWFPYIILTGAYLEDRLNRDIMAQLFISEGTFNRTRRAAIRSIARVLGEMDAQL